MSRRTKLIISAVFLVLLAIPVVYLVLAWSPENPLRFRIHSSQAIDFEKLDGKFEMVPIHVTVENVSRAPILFCFGNAYREGHRTTVNESIGFISPEFAMDLPLLAGTPPVSSEYWRIAPQTTIHCQLWATDLAHARAILGGESFMQYQWISSVKNQAIDCLYWVNDHTPGTMHRLIEQINCGEDRTVIEPSSSGATSNSK